MANKKPYETLELNVYAFNLSDIVRTSPNDDGEWDWN